MSIPWLGGESNNFFTNLLLWEGYEGGWPTNGPAEVGGDYEAMSPFGLPLINTAILLTSSVTITIAHHALLAGHRKILSAFLACTFLLGFVFVYLQGVEYIEAYDHLNLKQLKNLIAPFYSGWDEEVFQDLVGRTENQDRPSLGLDLAQHIQPRQGRWAARSRGELNRLDLRHVEQGIDMPSRVGSIEVSRNRY